MKKIIAIIMSLVIVFAFCSCGKDKTPQNDGQNSSDSQETPLLSQEDGVSSFESQSTQTQSQGQPTESQNESTATSTGQQSSVQSQNQTLSSQHSSVSGQNQTSSSQQSSAQGQNQNTGNQQSSVQSQNPSTNSQKPSSGVSSGQQVTNSQTSSSTNSSTPNNSQVTQSSGSTSQKPNTNVKYADQIYASARAYNKGQVAVKRDLSNTVYKLKNKKELNILYYGGSVTVGTGATDSSKTWANATTQWLKDSYPDAKINAVNAARGGTSTYWGLFRSERDLLPNKPDLVFIEFSVNDSYEGLYFDQSAYLMETLVRKINTELPETDIVLVFITDKGKIGQDFEEKAAHRAIAEHYGLPYIDAGQALYDEMNKTGKPISDYLIDYSHPNNEGYTVYANAVKEGLKKVLPDNATSVKRHVLPTQTYIKDGVNVDYTVLTADKINCGDTWEVGKRKKGGYTTLLKPREEGSSFSFDFEGNSIGIYAYIENMGNVRVTIDGKESKLITVPNPQGETEQLLFDNLAEGTHNVKFEYIGTGRFYLCAIFIG